MFRLSFILIVCIYGVLANLQDFDEWQYDVGRPSTSNAAGNSKCRKDLLLIVDTSYSIGKGDFDNNVKKFLMNLVTDSRLNVGQYGTHVGLILFSSERRTSVKLRIGQMTDPQQLRNYMNGLNWGEVSGSRTRTELALEIAKENMLQENSPANHRPDVDDVIVLITDGEPRGKRNTLELTKRYAQDLKDRKILLVTAAVGPKSNTQKFKELLEGLATSPDYFVKAEFKNMDAILGTLVARSCVKPGKCVCNEIISSPFFIEPGNSKALARWVEPQFACATGGKATIKSTVVEPPVSSPHAFGRGKHVINYTYELEGDVTVSCPVNIVVKGKLCRGKAFDSARQECCCGTIHVLRRGYACCGPDYYNTSEQTCCENSNLISRSESCPHNTLV